MCNGMSYDQMQGQGHEIAKVAHFWFSKSVSYAKYTYTVAADKWLLIVKLQHNSWILSAGFSTSVIVLLSRDWT